ncbi:HupE/UreJ family protein, partial [Roseovarius gaetbuli]|uniref:HupE/UreJ family protein n=1 Tax=Roseovarius gaetbuli TaxID=1356575 RepID=UPI001BAF1E12
MRQSLTIFTAALLLLMAFATSAYAHDVTLGDAGDIQETFGVHIISFIYLGAKHMMIGYDHILFLLGVFFLYYMKDVAIYVSLFAIGHSVTMLLGVWNIFATFNGTDLRLPARHNTYAKPTVAGWSSPVARQAHNLKVV